MSYTNTTLAQLQTRLLDRTEGKVWWTADQLRRAINEGMRIWNAITGQWNTAYSLLTIPNDPHLFVNGALVKATRVSMSGRVLTPTSLRGLDLAIPNWEGVNTATGALTPSQVSYWAPIGLTEIMLYPPDAPPGQNTITVDGVRNTPILVNPGDFLDMGDEEISTLLGYALHVLTFSQGISALRRTRPLMVAFFKAAAKKNATFAASSFYRKIVGIDRTRYSRLIENPPDPQAQALLQEVEQGGSSRGSTDGG